MALVILDISARIFLVVFAPVLIAPWIESRGKPGGRDG